MTDHIRRIKACLNGRRMPADHPGVPLTPGQLAEAAAGAVAAGGEAVHLHPRAASGRESLVAADVGAAVSAVRAACPQVPVGVTTGLWAARDEAARHAQVAGWSDLSPAERPDFASVNLSEDGWRDLLSVLHDLGIGVEAGVWSVADAIALTSITAGQAAPAPAAVRAAAEVGTDGPWLRILVEISGVGAAEAAARADEIIAQLHTGGARAPILLHGEDDSCWPLVIHAGRLGLATRIGLEDVLSGPDGRAVAGNADLVRLGLARWAAATVG